MLINEACNLTGLTKKAISYYEKHGLIKPRKCGNGYREYSKADILDIIVHYVALGIFPNLMK